MTAIHIDGLTQTYGGRPPVPALRGVDLTVADGAVTAVLGPSGCGKTTLLRVVAGLERAAAGTVHLGDRCLDDGRRRVPPEQRRIGLVPQEGALFPHLDVAANVAYGLRRWARSDRRARVDEVLDLVDLAGYGARRPHELSGGQQQRVALARALAPEPEVVLLDEPFSALDAALRTAIRDEVVDVLRRAGTTAVLVTHDQDEALSLADAVAVMRDGTIVQVDAPADLYRRPVDLWTAHFLGAVAVLPGHRTPDGAGVTTALGTLPLDPEADHAVGPEVTVGLRPEQVALAAGTAGTPATVEAMRFRGAFADVTLRVGTTTIVARWPAPALPGPDAPVTVTVIGPVLAFDAGLVTPTTP